MSDPTEPLDPEEQEKSLQDPDDPDLERGDYIEDEAVQAAVWAEADAVPQCADPSCEAPSVDGEFCELHGDK